MVLQEDPGFALQQWRGPRAFNNRYEPWERENSHPQVSKVEKRVVKVFAREIGPIFIIVTK